MKKAYRKLTEEQKKRGVIFSSCLSICMQEMENDTIHEIFGIGKDGKKVDFDRNQVEIKRLLDDKFFNKSHFKYNIVRR